jgi:hypothetical protein
MSGKPGRSPDDRLGRQHAVAPLIERYGARRHELLSLIQGWPATVRGEARRTLLWWPSS